MEKRKEEVAINNITDSAAKNVALKAVKKRETVEEQRRKRKAGLQAMIEEYDADDDGEVRPAKKARVDQAAPHHRAGSPRIRRGGSPVVKRLFCPAHAANAAYDSAYPPAGVQGNGQAQDWRRNQNDPLLSSPSYYGGSNYAAVAASGTRPAHLSSPQNDLGYLPPLPPYGANGFLPGSKSSDAYGRAAPYGLAQGYYSGAFYQLPLPRLQHDEPSPAKVTNDNNHIPSSSAPTFGNNLSSPSPNSTQPTTPHVPSSPPQTATQKEPIRKVEVISISSDDEPAAKRQRRSDGEQVDIYNDQYYSRHEVAAPPQHAHGNSVTRHYRERNGMVFHASLLDTIHGQLTAYTRLDEDYRQLLVGTIEARKELESMQEFGRWAEKGKLDEYFGKTAKAHKDEKAQLLSDIEVLKQEKLRAEADLRLIEKQEPAHYAENAVLKSKFKALREENADLRRRLGYFSKEVMVEREVEWEMVKDGADWDDLRAGNEESDSAYDFDDFDDEEK